MSITFNHLLEQLTHNEMICIAGNKGLDQRIENVTVIDSPEILDWIKGGEFVVSTGYVSYNNAGLLLKLVEGLKEKGAVGLGIKINRFYKNVPEILIKEGERLDFPIFAISYEMRISDIMKLVYANFFLESMSKTEREKILYQQVTKAILSGQDLGAAVYNISIAFDNPAFVVDEKFCCISYENHEKNQIQLERFLDLTGEKEAFNLADTHQIADFYEKTQFKLHRITVTDGEQIIGIWLCPIIIDKEKVGLLCLPETVKMLKKEDFSIVENSANVLAIYLLRKKMQKEDRQYSKESFLNHVLMNRDLSSHMVQHYCDMWGFDYTKKRVCLYVAFEQFNSMTYYKKKEITQLFEQCSKQIAMENKCLEYSMAYRDGFILFHLYKEDENEFNIRQNTMEAVEVFLERFSNIGVKLKLAVSVGGKNLQHIQESFRQCVEMERLGKMIFPDKQSFFYEDMVIYDLLGNNISLEHLLSIYHQTIGALDLYDKQNDTDFVYTLELFLENHCNTTKAANALHLHRNTMMYRMERIEDILKQDLKNPEVAFHLSLGIRAKKVLQIYER